MTSRLRIWLRIVTTSLIVVILGTVTIMAVRRARTLKPQVVEVSSDRVVGDEPADVSGETVGVYHGFEYSETVAGKTIFTLSADRTLAMASGWQEIEGVHLQLYENGRKGPLLTSDRASFNIQTRDAHLKGSVHVEFPNGSFVDTERGHFDSTSRHFVTDSPVLFAGPEVLGHAKRASYGLGDDELQLEGDVLFQARSGGALAAPRLRYSRRTGRIELPAGCRINDGSATLTAPHALLVLKGKDGRPQHLEMDGGVTLAGMPGAGGTTSGWAERVVANRDSADRWHVVASTHGRWVTLETVATGGLPRRTLQTWRLRAVVGAQGAESAWAEVAVCVEEVPDEGAPRDAESRSAQLWFSGGRPGHMEMKGDVIIHSAEAEGRGELARFLPEKHLAVLRGGGEGSAQRATLASGASWLIADEVQLFEAENRAVATGEVQGQVEDASLLSSESGPSDGPLHFAANSVEAQEGGALMVLRGDARVWQNQRLLLGDEVRYRQESGSLEATGHVRTTLPARQLNAKAGADDEALVVARALNYQRVSGTAVYTGDVRYTDPEHLLSAAKLEAVFGKGTSISTLDASGQVEIVDRVDNRRMTGDHSHYDAATDTVTVKGQRVQLTDAAGNMVSGTTLTWDQASGRVAVSGTPEAPSETIYHPEERP